MLRWLLVLVLCVALTACSDQPWEDTQLNQTGYEACTELGLRVRDDVMFTQWNESVRAINKLARESGDRDLVRNGQFMANVEGSDPRQMKRTATDGFAAVCFDKGWDG